MRKAVVGSMALVFAAAHCSSSGSSKTEEVSKASFRLTGQGEKLHLSGTPQDKSFKADYPNIQNVQEMVVNILASGKLDAHCRDASGNVECDETPFFSKAIPDGDGTKVVVYDIYGKQVSVQTFDASAFEAGTSDNSGNADCDDQNLGDLDGGSSDDSDASSSKSDGGKSKKSKNKDGGSSGSGSKCDGANVEGAKQQFCADINAWLKQHNIDETLDCGKLDQEFNYEDMRAPKDHENIPCKEIVSDAFKKIDGKFSSCGKDVEIRVENWFSSSRADLLTKGACRGSPLVLDLDGDGVRLSSLQGGVTFDLLGTGEKVQSAWPSRGDAFLALDRNENGAIDGASELFGNVTDGKQYEDGFSPLALLDDNADGRIDARDAAYGRLVVWSDRDRDGQSSAGELKALAEIGIKALELSVMSTSGESGWDSHGNWVSGTSEFVREDGTRGAMVDAFLRFKP